MIFGSALKKVFKDLTINGYTVQNSYGKISDLDLFISESDNLEVKKYPLLWWVTSSVEDQSNYFRCSSKLVIMVNTNISWLSEKRKINSFDNFIHPLYKKAIELIQKSDLKIHGDRKSRFIYQDIVNYGLGSRSLGSKYSDKSIVTDYIDARVINMTLDHYK